MPPRALLRRALAPLAAAASALWLLGCGNHAPQNRPSVVSIFPADGAALPGTVSYARVVYDERVRVLSDEGVHVSAQVDGDDEGVQVKVVLDPTDDHAVLVFPTENGHFPPNTEFNLVVSQAAVANMDDHYMLDEVSIHFTTGAPPNFFVTSSGAVHEIDRATGALVGTTNPPAGTVPHDAVGGDGRLWVWLDPVVPGASTLGTFVPGDATITTFVPLSGAVGAEVGARLLLSRDGRTLYAVGFDSGLSRVLVHRVDTQSLAEVAPPALLSIPVASAADVFPPTVEEDRHRLYVPTSNPAGGSFLSAISLGAFQEEDVGPLAGVDPLPVPSARGPIVWEPVVEALYMLDLASPIPAFTEIDADDLDLHATTEPTLVGVPVSMIVTADGINIVQGLSAFVPPDGLVETRAADLEDGFPRALSDDVGGVPHGATRVDVLLLDPFAEQFFAFASNGASSVLALYEYDEGDISQVDLDTVTVGVQCLPVGAPGVVTAATTLTGALPPP